MPVNQEVKKIISEIKYRCDYNQSEIAKELGIKNTYLSDVINGRVPFSDNLKNSIYEIFSDRMDWTTEEEVNDVAGLTSGEIEVLPTQETSSLVKVPYYDVDFVGGWNSYELFSEQKPSFIISSPDFARAQFACNLVGNSISNRIKNGSIIGLREIQQWKDYFPTNELYGVVTKNDLRTIKIVKRSKEKGYLDLIPDPLPELNYPAYETDIIPIEYVTKMYQVTAWAFFEKLAM